MRPVAERPDRDPRVGLRRGLRALAVSVVGLVALSCTAPLCPTGMSVVSNRYCISAYEVTVVTEVRSVGGRRQPVSTAVSRRGQTPTTGLSWRAARDVCAATPHGPGFLHLATSAEWEDAGDGVFGPGGTRYPYGDDWVSGRCGLPDPGAGPLALAEPPLTGSYPDCRGVWSVFDLLGGAWEWVDPEKTLDLAMELARASLVLDGDVILSAPGATVEAHWPGRVEMRAVGQVRLAGSGRDWQRPDGGWLHSGDARLPVRLRWFVEDERQAQLVLDRARDGEPITEKRGGAYYAGAGVDLRYAYQGHAADFIGSIGFRCAGPVLH